MNRIILFCLWLTLCVLPLSAQSTSECRHLLYFRFDDARVDTAYMNNAATCAALQSLLSSVDTAAIDSIRVVAYASPEGVYEHNLFLAKARVRSLGEYLLAAYPFLSDKLTLRSGDESWAHLRAMVCADSLLSEKDKSSVLAVLDADVNVGTKKWRMQQLDCYPYLYGRYYALLRHAAYCVLYLRQMESLPARGPESLHLARQASQEKIAAYDFVQDLPTSKPDSWREKREYVFLRSNLLCPLMHVAVDVPLGDYWSIGADYAYPWIRRNTDHKHCFQMLAWSLNTRYWFPFRDEQGDFLPRSTDDCMEGHSLGLNLSVAYYDFEWRYQGRQGELLSIAAAYRYAKPIFNDRMHLSFGLNVGHVYTEARPYHVLEKAGKAYRKGYTEQTRYWGLTQLELALVFPIKWRVSL